jgi:hypothetical protein
MRPDLGTSQYNELWKTAVEERTRQWAELMADRFGGKGLTDIDQIENDFVRGDIEAMKRHRCPRCGGRLLYSMSRGWIDARAPPGKRMVCGSSIYCVGECQYMLAHSDGFCPSWAEDIWDWDAFSASLNSDTISDSEAE